MSRQAGADLPLRGNGCVAADFDLDGHTDLYVTTAGYNVPTDTYDALLWNNGDGTFTEGARRRRDRRARLARRRGRRRRERRRASRPVRRVVHRSQRSRARPRRASRRTTSPCATSSTSTTARTTERALDVPRGRTSGGHRAVRPSGTASARCSPTTTATDGSTSTSRTTPIRTSSTGTSRPGGPAATPGSASASKRSRRREASTIRTQAWGSPPPTSAATGGPTCFVTNSRGQLHAAYRSRPAARARAPRSRTHVPSVAAALGTHSTGWGASWADLDLDGDLDLALANGAIPSSTSRRTPSDVR